MPDEWNPCSVSVLAHEIADERVVVHNEHSTAGSHVRCHTDRAHACKKRTGVTSTTNSQQNF